MFIVPFYWAFMWMWARQWWEEGHTIETDAQKQEAVAICVHTLPLISSFVELVITKMVFLKKDAKWSLIIGLLYIPVNYFGGRYEKDAVYSLISYLNWSKPW